MMENDFFAYSRQTIVQANADGRYEVAHNRGAALRCLELFLGKERLSFDELSSDFMAQFKGWLTAHGRKESTARLYLNQISTMYNVAVKEGIAPKVQLLKGIRAAMPAKQARQILTEEELRRMRYADLSDSRPMTFARDMFLFSVYGRGISIADMAYIKKSDICGASLTYTSQTVGQPRVTIPWDAAMQEIADRYTPYGDFLLPVVKSEDETAAHRDVKHVRENIVRGLKQIAVRCNLSVVPSMYMVKDIYQRAIDSVCVSKII